MPDYSNKTLLFIDQGLYVHIAEALAPSFARCFYYCNGWRNAFPSSVLYNIGRGLEAIEVVDNPWPYVERADLIVFPDTYFGAEQSYLRANGKRVWGSGDAELLELHRDELKVTLKSLRLPVSSYVTLNNLTELRDYLRENPGVYVKGNTFRGDIETFCNKSPTVTAPLLDDLAAHLGPRQHHTRFVVEDPIEGVEVGYDGFCIDGQFATTALYGYEHKDAGFIGRVCAFDDLPVPLQFINEKLGPTIGELDCRSFFSTEVRVGPDRKPYLMDPAMRAGSPPSEVYIELYSNWPEIIYEGAAGTLIDPTPTATYAVEIILRSDWVREHFLALDFPDDIRQWVKIHGHCRMDGKDYAVPMGVREFGAVVALSDSLETAVKECQERAAMVEGLEVEYDTDALNKILETIEEGQEYGVNW